MCVTLTKQAGFSEVEGEDVVELLECCDNDMSTDKLEQLPKAYMAVGNSHNAKQTTPTVSHKQARYIRGSQSESESHCD
jgi:hypothetical protein